MAAIRFRDFEDQELKDALAELQRKAWAGIASISYNGETITYSSPAIIERAMRAIEHELDARARKKAGLPARSPLAPFYMAAPGKGFN